MTPMTELTEVDKLETWLVLNLIEHAHPEDRPRLNKKAADLVYRLRKEGKLVKDKGVI